MFCKLHLNHVKTNNIQNIIGGFLLFNTSCDYSKLIHDNKNGDNYSKYAICSVDGT